MSYNVAKQKRKLKLTQKVSEKKSLTPQEMKTLNVAMRARGFVPRTNLRTMSILGGYVGTLLVRSFERTERVYKAMLSKGYNGTFPTMVEFSSDGRDFAKAAIVLALAVGLLVTDMAGPFHTAVEAWY